jgi:hypothetical protein
MQTPYVGDAGDFGKLGLLRHLCGIYPESFPRLTLGVIWYLVSTNEANNDGKHDGYLNLKNQKRSEKDAKTYAVCDPELYAALKDIRLMAKLSIVDLQNPRILSTETSFFKEPLSYDHLPWAGPMTRQHRITHRAEWFAKALSTTECAQVVFVDPDNGLEVRSTQIHEGKSPKFVFFDELSLIYRRGQSLVIYHHLGQHDGHRNQIAERAAQIDTKFKSPFPTIALRYRRGTARVFFLKAANNLHDELFRKSVGTLLNSAWGENRHFELIHTPL